MRTKQQFMNFIVIKRGSSQAYARHQWGDKSLGVFLYSTSLLSTTEYIQDYLYPT